MSTNVKPALIFVVSVLVFAGLIFFADIGLLDYVRTRFYNPSIVNSVIKENHRDAELVQNHINELQNKFAATLNEPAVCSSFLYNQSAEDIFERSRIYGILLETVSGLQSVQFIDSGGIRIHYSTSARDVVSQSSDSTSYRNYAEDSRALQYDRISVSDYGDAKFTMDDSYDRIFFSYPFYDSMDVYWGTALFTISVRALAERLIAEGRLKANDDVSVIGIPPGVVLGSPASSKTDILDKISSIWSKGIQDRVTLDAEDSGAKFALISTKTNQDLLFGRLINDSVFSISDSMALILLLSMFLTFFLTVFFLINLKPNPAALVQNRINNLQANLFEQLYINKTSQDRAKWILELEQRRGEIRSELKHKLKLNRSSEKNIDSIIDRAWDELLAVIKSGSGHAVLEGKPIKTKTTKKAEELDEVEEIEEVGEIKEIVKLGEVEESDEIEELGEIEEIEGVEEIYELEEIEEIEEIDELDEIEEIEGAEEIYELEEIEEIEEADELDEIEEIEGAEEVDELEEIEEIEKAEELGEIEEIEEVDELDEAEEIEELGEIEEIEEVDELDEVEEIEELNEAEEIEELGEVEEIEETEEIDMPVPVLVNAVSKGLLALASEIEKTSEREKIKQIEELETLEEAEDAASLPSPSPASARPARGLLALASREKIRLSDNDEPETETETDAPVHNTKGLLALASEIEFSQNQPAEIYENDEDLNTELNIVSPFPSMFSSLS